MTTPIENTSSLCKDSLPFQDKLRTFFFDQMEHRTSAFLYGSAATGNWVAARSDLDLVILISEDQIESLGEMVNRWKVTPGYPILDGFALFSSRNVLMTKRLEEYHRRIGLAVSEIQIIDLWNMKYRSKYLFGMDFVKELPDIWLSDLSEWARKELVKSFGASHPGDLPKVDHALSGLIWSVSWSGRMLMLARGMVCDSKFEAINWLGQEYEGIREPIRLLLSDFYKSDSDPISVTATQSELLRKFLMRQMMLEAGSF